MRSRSGDSAGSYASRAHWLWPTRSFIAMPEKLTSDERAVFHLMLRALKGRPLVPRHVANASFAIMCLALSKMDANERDALLAKLDAAARSQVTSFLAGDDGGVRWN
jgi:hypothetical protein